MSSEISGISSATGVVTCDPETSLESSTVSLLVDISTGYKNQVISLNEYIEKEVLVGLEC